MASTDTPFGPIMGLIDTIISDQPGRDAARLELLKPDHAPLLRRLGVAMADPAAPVPVPDPADRWTERARPSFLYVMYTLLLWSIPMGLIAAVRPHMARDIASGMTAYLNGIPEPLYALFGTGYLGYTMARTWGKTKGVE